MGLGNTVTFGRYEQDNNSANGPEPIEWTVMDYNSSSRTATLVSRYVLDTVQAETGTVLKNWRTSNLNRWINDEFIPAAFSPVEQAALYGSVAPVNKETLSRIYLTTEEVLGVPTAYAIDRGVEQSLKVKVGDVKCAWYWLGTGTGDNLPIVNLNGDYKTYPVNKKGGGFRPMIVVNLTSDAITEGKALPEEEQLPVEYTGFGTQLTFGRYEQDNDHLNGMEPIVWIVTEYSAASGELTLVSRYALDTVRYNSASRFTSWRDSSIRVWLNSTFMRTAFTNNEIRYIVNTINANGGVNGPATQERIYLPSSSLRVGGNKRTSATPYAISRGAQENNTYVYAGQPCCTWWEMSAAKTNSAFIESVNCVLPDGTQSTANVASDDVAVRPMLRLNAHMPGLADLLTIVPPETAPRRLAPEERCADDFRQIGNIVTYGQYEQDNDPANGDDDVEWIVLDYDAETNSALLITRGVLAHAAFNASYDSPYYRGWSNSNIRTWLNGTLYNSLFSANEKRYIRATKVVTPKLNEFDGGPDTHDRLFLLNRAEVSKYFPEDRDRIAPLSRKAALTRSWTESDAMLDGFVSPSWWLRSPGTSKATASIIATNGTFGVADVTKTREQYGVRPAMWLDLSSFGGPSTQPKPFANAAVPAVPITASACIEGRYVTMGTYEQDGDYKDKEPIEWLVLDIDEENNRALLISRYGLEPVQFHATGAYPTWEKSDIRNRLNISFFKTAFTDAERAWIVPVKHTNEPYEGTKGGADTTDSVFLLSYREVRTYFPHMRDRVCSPTPYAVTKGAYKSALFTVDSQPACIWWLRTPGHKSGLAMDIFGDGAINDTQVRKNDPCLRPAMWVDLSALPR